MMGSATAFPYYDRPGSDQVVVRFYPNPATSFINFEFGKIEKGYTLQIYAFVGRKMTEVRLSANKITIPLDNYFRGIYIYQVRDNGGKIVESGKFQVK
jgi:hypothetical protein